jgi:nicotinamidase-related amidase
MPLIRAADSALLIVDVQAKLLPHIHDGERVLDNCAWLVKVALRLGVPVMVSEQYPQGLGPTVPAIATLVPPGIVREKIHFSCAADGCLADLPAYARPQIVIAGIEAHVCVLQTALGLRASGKEVFVAADAVGSRRVADRELALQRMRDNGAEVVSREMVAFEWLHRAGTEQFRAVSRDFIR